MIDCLSIVETDKVIHTVKIDIVKLMVEIESFGMSSDEFDKETGSSDGLQPKQADLSYFLGDSMIANKCIDLWWLILENRELGDACKTANPVMLAKLPIRLKATNLVETEKLLIQLTLKATNPVEIKKLLIRLSLKAANPVETEKLLIRLRLKAANLVKTEKLLIRLDFILITEIFKSLSLNLYATLRSCVVTLMLKHEVLNLDSAGNEAATPSSNPEIRQLAINDEFGFVIHLVLGFLAQSVGSSNAITLESSYLLVLITGASQSRQHVDTSLIHIESCKSPIESLFDVGLSRISIVTMNTKEYHSDVLAESHG
ncbi:hypothetical protein Tco_1202734 [Tanacetum coccineum]